METCTVGEVVRIHGGRAEVRIDRQEGCASCQSADLCHALGRRGELLVTVENAIGARAGQRVEIAAERALGLRAAAVVYLVPAIFFVAGVVVGSELLGWPPWASGLLGVGALALSWAIAFWADRTAQRSEKFRLSIARIVS